jgi:hypothetical protein
VNTGGVVDDTCNNDFVEALRASYHNDQLFELWAPEIRFSIGPVPIVISHYFKPSVSSTVTAKVTSAAFSASGQIELDLTVGNEFKDGAWGQTWEADPTGSIGLQLSPDTGGVDLASTLSYGVVFTTLLYATSGPEVGLTISGSLSASTASSTCTWHADLALSGADAVFGTDPQLPVLEPELLAVSGNATVPSANITHTEGPMPVCAGDGGVDAGIEAGVEAGIDAGVDASIEAGMDAGVDAQATDSAGPDA